MKDISCVVKASLLQYGILIFSFTPMLLPFLFLRINQMDEIDRLNIFFLSLICTLLIFYMLSPSFQALHKESKKIELSSHWQYVILDVGKWFKQHTMVTFGIFIGLVIVMLMPLQGLLLWMNSIGVPQNIQLLVISIGALFITVPFSIASAFYESVIMPKRATIAQIENIMKTIHPTMEITRNRLLTMMKIEEIIPNKLMSRLLVLTGFAVIALIEAIHYLDIEVFLKVSAISMFVFMILFICISLFSKHIILLDYMLEGNRS